MIGLIATICIGTLIGVLATSMYCNPPHREIWGAGSTKVYAPPTPIERLRGACWELDRHELRTLDHEYRRRDPWDDPLGRGKTIHDVRTERVRQALKGRAQAMQQNAKRSEIAVELEERLNSTTLRSLPLHELERLRSVIGKDGA